MTDNKNCRESVCIDASRVLDSCRDRDCFESVRVYITEHGQSLIDKTNSIRIKCTDIICTNLEVSPVPFNSGFYQVYVRFYTKLTCEACLCPGKIQEFDGIAVCDKKVCLFGGDGYAKIFRSSVADDDFCSQPCDEEVGNNLPTATCEVVDPVVLAAEVEETCNATCGCGCGCNISAEELPARVCSQLGGAVSGQREGRNLYVTLGFFSILRLTRPAQFMLDAIEYTVPDKECCPSSESDPCALFSQMPFPVNEFSACPTRRLSSGR